MGINPKGCFLGDMGRKILVIFQDKKVGFFLIFQEIIILVMWDGVLGENGWICFFFCDMVT
jgi:hypothetical protein